MRWGIAAIGAAAALAVTVAGCGNSATSANTSNNTAVISVIGAENEYANVLGQIGGRYVQASAILDNPNTDPHTFEASPSVAQKVSAAHAHQGRPMDHAMRVEHALTGDGEIGSLRRHNALRLAAAEP